MKKKPHRQVRAAIYAACLIATEMSDSSAERIRIAQNIAKEKIAARWQREYAFQIQEMIRDRDIRQVYMAELKRGERGGSNNGSDRRRNENLKRKIAKYAFANRAYYAT